jgi:sarcosine oxidase subunit delta
MKQSCPLAAKRTLNVRQLARMTRRLRQYLFQRENPKGVHFERWRHVYGCGKWFHAARCTATLEVFGTYSAQTLEPPQDIKDKITAKRPGWTWGNFS